MEHIEEFSIEEDATYRRHLAIILVVSALLTAFNLYIVFHRMPFEGDSFEYAALARSLILHGELRENLVRTYSAFPEPPLPHPAAQRAGLYPFILVPFVAVLGNSPWAFIIPYQIFFFLFPFVAYWAGLRFFPPRISLFAALTAAAHPRILFFAGMEDPGQPEMLLALCLLASLACAARSRFFPAGLLVAVGVLLKQTALLLLPALFVWILLYSNRRHIALSHLALGVLLALSPLLVRNAIVFNNPVHSEQLRAVSGVDFRDYREGNLIKAILSLPAEESSDKTAKSANPKPYEMLRLRINKMLIGNSMTIGYFPGIATLLFAAAVPFFLVGLAVGIASVRGRPERALLLLVILAALVFFIAAPVWYADRYIHFMLPVFFLFAYGGVESLRSLWKGFTASRLFAFVCAAEILPMAFIFLLTAAEPGENFRRVTYRELKATCAWVRENTPPNSTLMTVPFWSPQFFCDRKTVPVPYGKMADVVKVLGRYEADYFLFANYFQADIPEIPFLRQVTRGNIVNLYSVDRTDETFIAPSSLPVRARNYNFLKNLFAKVPRRNLNPTLFGSLESLVPSPALRLAIVYLFLLVFLGIFHFERSRLGYVLIFLIVFVLSTIPRVHYMMNIPKPDLPALKVASGHAAPSNNVHIQRFEVGIRTILEN
ncbi:MAG: glycosyltransferase family 39 protein [bacterium]